MPRKASPNSPKYYFTTDTESAIVEYNQCTDDRIRNKIYETQIKYPLNKLVENLIHRFKFYHFDIPYEDVKHEAVTFLFERLNKYSPDKGKAFSYFSIVAKNYLINENNTNYYTSKNTDGLEVVDDSRSVINEIARQDKIEDDKEFMDLFAEYVETNMAQFTTQILNKKSGRMVTIKLFDGPEAHLIADSILELFRKRTSIEVFNKKALYILVKERSGVEKTQEITKILKRIEDLYKDLFINWSKTGRMVTKYLPAYNY